MDEEKALGLTIVLFIIIILAWVALRSGPERQEIEGTCSESCSEWCDWIAEGDRGAAARCFFDCYAEQCEPPLPEPLLY